MMKKEDKEGFDYFNAYLNSWRKKYDTEKQAIEGCHAYIENLIKDYPERYSYLKDLAPVPGETKFTVYHGTDGDSYEISEYLFLENSSGDLRGHYTMYFNTSGDITEDEIDTGF